MRSKILWAALIPLLLVCALMVYLLRPRQDRVNGRATPNSEFAILNASEDAKSVTAEYVKERDVPVARSKFDNNQEKAASPESRPTRPLLGVEDRAYVRYACETLTRDPASLLEVLDTKEKLSEFRERVSSLWNVEIECRSRTLELATSEANRRVLSGAYELPDPVHGSRSLRGELVVTVNTPDPPHPGNKLVRFYDGDWPELDVLRRAMEEAKENNRIELSRLINSLSAR